MLILEDQLMFLVQESILIWKVHILEHQLDAKAGEDSNADVTWILQFVILPMDMELLFNATILCLLKLQNAITSR